MTTTTKYLLFGALGVAAVLLLSSYKANGLRNSVEDTAMKNAKKWRDRLSKIGAQTNDTISDLRDMLANEIDGVSDDARERIEAILDGAQKSTGKVRKAASKQLS